MAVLGIPEAGNSDVLRYRESGPVRWAPLGWKRLGLVPVLADRPLVGFEDEAEVVEKLDDSHRGIAKLAEMVRSRAAVAVVLHMPWDSGSIDHTASPVANTADLVMAAVSHT